MEVIAFSVLSAVILKLGIASFLFYKYIKKVDCNIEEVKVQVGPKSKQPYPRVPKKQSAVKSLKKIQHHRKKPRIQDDDASGTENYTTEQQLVQAIINQRFTIDSINMTALDEKPSAKQLKERAVSTGSKIPLPVLQTEEWDSEWENVTDKRKKKVYAITQIDDRYQFTLDAAGGIVELPFCEIQFPAESVRESLLVSVQTETYDKIERKDPGNTWMTVGRTEFLQGMPVNIVGDCLTSFRAVITRAQSGDVSRNLKVAAYIAKPKISNPKHHYLHICIYDNSQQTQYKVHSNMQKLLLKMEPKTCNIPFGCNVALQLEATQKYTPDDKEIFMRWTEVCKAFVNVRFQIKLNRSESVHPNFEPQFRTMVFLTLNKVGMTQTWKQEEYFYFYWISGNSFYPNKRKNKDQSRASMENRRKNVSIAGRDTAASGSNVIVAEETERNHHRKEKSVMGTNPLFSKPVIKSVGKNQSTKIDAQMLPSSRSADRKPSSTDIVHNKQAKPSKPQQSEAPTPNKPLGSDLKHTIQSDEARVLTKKSSKKVYRRRRIRNQLKHDSDQNLQPSKFTQSSDLVGKKSEGQSMSKNSNRAMNSSRNWKKKLI